MVGWIFLRKSCFGVRRVHAAFKWSGATYVCACVGCWVVGAPHPFKAVSSGFAILRTTALHITHPTICLFFFSVLSRILADKKEEQGSVFR